ncbi:hypothetical protein LCGC14_1574730 [marine sediment metagenome]|uniref:Uncharacterized protein n=1 Tax=marine sediment metagenome TaxID=412755 RepID=A0A0F9KZM1_9ZZZZ
MDIRPIPSDPSIVQVKELLEADDSWFLTRPGEFQTAAVETWQSDGTGWQRLILMTWPARHNHGDEDEEVRLAISVEDAMGLVDTLIHTIKWLREAEALGQ